MQKQHTVLCIQDLSCVGRCSLAVVLPALAAMGVQPCALPTALLSPHTGGLGRPARTFWRSFPARRRTERTPPAMHPFCCSAFPRCAAPW